MDAQEELSDDDIIGVLTTEAKKRREAAEAFERTGTYFEEECGFGSTTTTSAP